MTIVSDSKTGNVDLDRSKKLELARKKLKKFQNKNTLYSTLEQNVFVSMSSSSSFSDFVSDSIATSKETLVIQKNVKLSGNNNRQPNTDNKDNGFNEIASKLSTEIQPEIVKNVDSSPDTKIYATEYAKELPNSNEIDTELVIDQKNVTSKRIERKSPRRKINSINSGSSEELKIKRTRAEFLTNQLKIRLNDEVNSYQPQILMNATKLSESSQKSEFESIISDLITQLELKNQEIDILRSMVSSSSSKLFALDPTSTTQQNNVLVQTEFQLTQNQQDRVSIDELLNQRDLTIQSLTESLEKLQSDLHLQNQDSKSPVDSDIISSQSEQEFLKQIVSLQFRIQELEQSLKHQNLNSTELIRENAQLTASLENSSPTGSDSEEAPKIFKRKLAVITKLLESSQRDNRDLTAEIKVLKTHHEADKNVDVSRLTHEIEALQMEREAKLEIWKSLEEDWNLKEFQHKSHLKKLEEEWEIQKTSLFNEIGNLNLELEIFARKVEDLKSEMVNKIQIEREAGALKVREAVEMTTQLMDKETERLSTQLLLLKNNDLNLIEDNSEFGLSDQLKIDNLQLLDTVHVLEERITTLQNTIAELNNLTVTQQTTILKLETDLANVNTSKSELQTLTKATINELNSYKESNENMQATIRIADSNVLNFEKQLQSLRNQFQSVSEDKITAEKNLQELQSRFTSTLSELSQTQSQLQAAYSELHTTRMNFDQDWLARSQETSSNRSSYPAISIDLDQKQKNEMVLQLSASKIECDTLKQQLESLKSASHERDLILQHAQDLEAQILTLEKRLTREKEHWGWREQSLTTEVEKVKKDFKDLEEIKKEFNLVIPEMNQVESLLDWMTYLLTEWKSVLEQLTDAHLVIDKQHQRLEKLLDDDYSPESTNERQAWESVEVEVQTDPMMSFARMSTIKAGLASSSAAKPYNGSRRGSNASSVYQGEISGVGDYMAVVNQLADLTARYSQLQQTLNVANNQLQHQLNVNSDMKRIIVDPSLFDPDNLLERYNDVIVLLGEARAESERWKARCEEVEEVVEAAVLARITETDKEEEERKLADHMRLEKVRIPERSTTITKNKENHFIQIEKTEIEKSITIFEETKIEDVIIFEREADNLNTDVKENEKKQIQRDHGQYGKHKKAKNMLGICLPSRKSMVIISGGSALNPFVHMLQNITDNIAYVLPVSDDGGSTAEIVRTVGGPGIGDIRSRLIRLSETYSEEARNVHELLTYRLPSDTTPLSAKNEWNEIVEGRHLLWNGISEPYRETIRAFLCHFHSELLKQAGTRGPFDFRSGSIGNFFLTGSRLFFNSLEAAIFQFARITRNPERTVVIPVNATSGSQPTTIAALLLNEKIIYGQCEISHPGAIESHAARLSGSRRSSKSQLSQLTTDSRSRFGASSTGASTPTIPGHVGSNAPAPVQISAALSSAQNQGTNNNILFSKLTSQPLPSPIRRIFYVNSERQEVLPKINPLLIPHLSTGGKKTIIYAVGSLYTSIIPCLIVPGMGNLLYDSIPSTSPLIITSTNSNTDAKTMRRSRSAHAPLNLTNIKLTNEPSNNAAISKLTPLKNPALKSLIPQNAQRKRENSAPVTHFNENLPLILPNHMPPPRVKILLLNGSTDREVQGYTALDFIFAITDALNYSFLANLDVESFGKHRLKDIFGEPGRIKEMSSEYWKKIQSRNSKKSEKQTDNNIENNEETDNVSNMLPPEILQSDSGRTYLGYPNPPGAYITHLVYADDSLVPVSVAKIEKLGIICCKVRSPVIASEQRERMPSFDSLQSTQSSTGEYGNSRIADSVSGKEYCETRERGYYDVEELRKLLEPLVM
ncbi:hypothetical protein HK096_005163 [Nowakowskiella sp. JEL0078]|nr:hypothetical protein HK096_005163 [Nowakowskiella sp. JEL0078]